MEQCRQGKSAKRIRNFGKRIGSEGWARGSRPRTRRLSADCSSCSRGESGSPRAGRGTDRERPPQGPSPGVEQSTQNWYGQGESDCLIKTKHCDGPSGCSRNVISAQCSECQSEEIQPSAGIASGRPVTKCRFAEFRREHFCSRHCEWPSRASADVSHERRFQVQICRIQAQALISSRRPMRKCRFQPLAAAGIASVPVPSPSADLHNPGAIALLQQALRVAVPSPSADFSHERCCSGGMQLAGWLTD
ncbi:hypothetical protein OPV22_002485 [Ensete ventricosum]|uniref:Uncharacterized protein n=1 Tax=Ensete ventricosum TaxID=4639 RepID=A0AAV8RY44_ENSVE|nr:hypothetical protein OPV22_002485 [Ensete ventricosum]